MHDTCPMPGPILGAGIKEIHKTESHACLEGNMGTCINKRPEAVTPVQRKHKGSGR